MERYYLGSNTAKGFCSLYEGALKDMKHTVLLKGGPGTGKSSLIKKVAEEGTKRGYEVELWHCSGDPLSLDGVYIKGLEKAVVDATSPHAIEPKIPVVKESIVNLLDCVDKNKIEQDAYTLEKHINDKKQCFVSAYEHLNIALCYYKRIERTLLESIDMSRLRMSTRRVVDEVKMKSVCGGRRKTGLDRFDTAITPDGKHGYFDHLNDREICVIKGEDVSVNLFLKELVRAVTPDVIFHDGFYGDSLSGILVHDLAIVKNVGAHSPHRVIDLTLYEGDKRFQIGYSKMSMDEEIATAVGDIKEARMIHGKIEKHYVDAMDFDHLNEIASKVVQDIFG